MRTAGDSWDIVSSVGLTALGVATFRALESARDDALITDEFARWFVEAAGDQHFLEMLAEPSRFESTPFFPGTMGIRTKFFDDYFLAAAADGATQAVIVAAGLDARAFRLEWPTGTTVFEIDQPKVLQFKQEVLDEHGAQPRVDRRTVAVDLRDDWPAALETAGFSPERPSAWSAEGLLAYLPGPAHDALFGRINELSDAGSHLAVDGFGSGADIRRFQEIRRKYLDQNPFGNIDISQLFYDDTRAEPAEWLTEHGWRVQTRSPLDLAAQYGRDVPDLPDDLREMAERPTYLTAESGSCAG
ncbi:SAM-dependent methyltransferase [Speluncibacter jeojiensis]|uniref:S-adenosyl-L-methionine-dependent methyltransferase n=1 Tax=Speluncibacter jeojiensis TaxID=2710754 RepID=A0A9X4M0A9_9ACTN|nr:SAM-dependent methyltransferase [Corynebacteriales bacterium D3-21]